MKLSREEQQMEVTLKITRFVDDRRNGAFRLIEVIDLIRTSQVRFLIG